MNDITNTTDDLDTELPGSDELTLLKTRARVMGIQFSNNIGLLALRQKIEAKQAESEDEVPSSEAVNALTGEDPKAPVRNIRQLMVEEELKLVRLRITNMDPKKKDLPGEILTVANEYLGTIRKFIPFGEVTDNGYHVPWCLYQQMLNRRFVNIRTRKGANGQTHVEHSMAKEFSLEVLPPLTAAEIERLAVAQAAAGTFTQPD